MSQSIWVPSTNDRTTSWLLGNALTLAGLFLFLLVAVRVSLISRLSLTTSVTVLQGVGIPTLSLAVLSTLLPPIFLFLGALASLLTLHSSLLNRTFGRLFYVVAVVTLGFIGPWWTAVYLFLAGPILLAPQLLRRLRFLDGLTGKVLGNQLLEDSEAALGGLGDAEFQRPNSEATELKRVGDIEGGRTHQDTCDEYRQRLALAEGCIDRMSDRAKTSAVLALSAPALALLLSGMLSSTPWLAAEVVGVDNDTPENGWVGYVLRDDGDWFTILTENSRRIIYIEAENVSYRKSCLVGKASVSRTLWDVVDGRTSRSPYPVCSTLIPDLLTHAGSSWTVQKPFTL